MTEPVAKMEQIEIIERKITIKRYYIEKAEEKNDSDIGTIIYNLNREDETFLDSKVLKRRRFDWKTGHVDSEIFETTQICDSKNQGFFFENISNRIKWAGSQLCLPFKLYSTLLIFWMQFISSGQQDLYKRKRSVLSMNISMYMVAICYGVSLSTSLTYSTIKI